MSPISQRFAIPENDDEFEEMCLQLLQRFWSRPGLEIFGKRGERQYGIDILDVSGETPIYAAQCKLKEEHKSLSPAEIQEEVDKAKQFVRPLGKYGILTTAKVSTAAQIKIREINEIHKVQDLFEVQLLTWDRLCGLLQQYTEVQEQFYGGVPFERAAKIEATVVAINDGVQSLTSKIDGDRVDSEINEARDCIVQHEFQSATFLLNRIQRDHGSSLSSHQRFRVFSNHGAAALGLGYADTAAKCFLQAVACAPEDEQAKTNEALAYLLVGDSASCHAKAGELRKQYPGSSRLAALWLTSAKKDISLKVLESEVTPILRRDPEVGAALARRALAELDLDTAFEYASSATKLAPKWSQPQLFWHRFVWVGRSRHN